MDKIKVGEYVRTKTGKIDKVINNNYYMPQYIECEKRIVEKENIVNHSFNIKELIENKDIVEYRINCLSELKVGRVKKYRDARNNKQYLGVEGYDIINIYIETILTHEQYERDCYKIN